MAFGRRRVRGARARKARDLPWAAHTRPARVIQWHPFKDLLMNPLQIRWSYADAGLATAREVKIAAATMAALIRVFFSPMESSFLQARGTCGPALIDL